MTRSLMTRLLRGFPKFVEAVAGFWSIFTWPARNNSIPEGVSVVFSKHGVEPFWSSASPVGF